ncbi:hypothetical protein Ddc_10946 [Ditylenchus destructor]|nr:hypothetical protein Ddc_10946 [Ditylenchus destructor]
MLKVRPPSKPPAALVSDYSERCRFLLSQMHHHPRLHQRRGAAHFCPTPEKFKITSMQALRNAQSEPALQTTGRTRQRLQRALSLPAQPNAPPLTPPPTPRGRSLLPDAREI